MAGESIEDPILPAYSLIIISSFMAIPTHEKEGFLKCPQDVIIDSSSTRCTIRFLPQDKQIINE